MARRRNYGAEYRRRKELGRTRGVGLSAARGHGAPVPRYDRRLEEGLRQIRRGASLTNASRSIRVAPERLRRYLSGTGVVERRGRRLFVVEDLRDRFVPIYTRGRERVIEVRGFDDASVAGRYMATVQRFLDTNDPVVLETFRGVSITARGGRTHPLETDPRTLYRLDAASTTPFDEIYRIVA